MSPDDANELVARTKAILAYARTDRTTLLRKAGIKASDLKAWLDSSKPAHPGMEHVVDLARAAGVPRRFAERGFEDLRETRDEISELRDQLAQIEQRLPKQPANPPAAAPPLPRLDPLPGTTAPGTSTTASTEDEPSTGAAAGGLDGG